MGMGKETRDRIAKRAAQELKNGMAVNLGIGIPTQVADYVPEGVQSFFMRKMGFCAQAVPRNQGKKMLFSATQVDIPSRFSKEPPIATAPLLLP